uniref:Prolyl endopeptidase n=1 Tax=Strongyloides stercoralis TaxID=6248 RepID=A0A0K0E076_STRER
MASKTIVAKKPRKRLTQTTIDLLKLRRKKINCDENMQDMAKALKERITADYRAFAEQKAKEAAEKKMSFKECRQTYSLRKEATVSIKNKNGKICYSIKEIAKIIEEFYSSLFAKNVQISSSVLKLDNNVPEIT